MCTAALAIHSPDEQISAARALADVPVAAITTGTPLGVFAHVGVTCLI